MAELLDLDAALMRRVAAGDAGAFRRLAESHLPRAVGFATRLVGRRDIAEELVQEAFAVVWEKAAVWRPEARFRTWLYRVIANLASKHRRDRLRDHDLLDEAVADDGPGVEERLLTGERQAAVRRALLELPERQRLAVVLFYYEEMSQREACQAMGIGEGAFESLLSRGKAGLRARLAGNTLS